MSRQRLLVMHGAGAPKPRFWLEAVQQIADVSVVLLDPEGSLAADFPAEVLLASGDLERCVTTASGHLAAGLADGVMTMAEQLVVETAELAAAHQLCGHHPTAARRMRDKNAQRSALARAGLRTPRFAQIASASDTADALRTVGLPAVLKPRVGMASLATFRVDSMLELDQAYRDGVAVYEQDARVNGLPPVFILEELLVGVDSRDDLRFGDYVSVETISSPAGVHIVTVTDKLPLQHPFREQGDLMPSSLPAALLSACETEAVAAVTAMGRTHGAAHTELKITVDGPCVIEVNGRLGGIVAELLQLCSDYNIVVDLARVALGSEPKLPVGFTGWASMYHPHAPVNRHRFRGLSGLIEARGLPEVRELREIQTAGKEIDWRTGDTRLFRTLAQHDSVDAAFRSHRMVAQLIDPLYDDH